MLFCVLNGKVFLLWQATASLRRQSCCRLEPNLKTRISFPYIMESTTEFQELRKSGQAHLGERFGVVGDTTLMRFQFDWFCRLGGLIVRPKSGFRFKVPFGQLIYSGDIPFQSMLGTQC